ncbi:hypothetical protein EDB81DRAFT_813991 [Dactylonectria macrodidyma]|uniref:Glycosyl transferase CAP10 domain-containing protein n=1 Tax=Dactylonectria macrodidyma TaxID=307937 RepID=A0A9P9IGU5_9HYPO|nr:hypothetical protein EDB81DRAFT_813991 [Dactylonectria macrodidyma]
MVSRLAETSLHFVASLQPNIPRLQNVCQTISRVAMWKQRLADVDPATGSAGAALLCTILTQCLSSRPSELTSEVLSWSLLPILFKSTRPSDLHTIPKTASPINLTSSSTSTRSLWIIAAGITASSVCNTESNVVAYLPALTPLLLVTHKHLGSKLYTSTASDSWIFLPLVDSAWGTGVVACFASLTLLNWDVWGSALAIIPFISLLIIYTILLPRNSKSSAVLPLVDIQDAIVPLSLRVVVTLALALGAHTFFLGFPTSSIMPTISLGLAKALSWYFATQVAQHSSWSTVTAIGTFSITSTRNPFTYSSDTHAISHVVASILALGQAIYMLPKQANTRPILWGFLLISLVPYFLNLYAISYEQSSAPNYDWLNPHPVEALAQKAKKDFEQLSNGQSRTYLEAYNEYERRYKNEPPPGFEAWYTFAASNQSPIIDDFDLIYDAVSPFWKLSGREVLEVMRDAQNAKGGELWLCSLSGDSAKTSCSHPTRKIDRHVQILFDTLTEELRGTLPNVGFLVNHLDEPRVLIPRALPGESEPTRDGQFNLTNMSHQPVWNAITKYCPAQPSAGASGMKHRVETYGLPFITNRTLALDLCRNPQYRSMHGMFMSPTSFRLIEGLVPVLSVGAPSTMGDVLYPSPAYLEEGFKYDEIHDVDWEKKRNNLYWAGSTTGAYVSDCQWRNYHRQRFVQLGQNLGGQKHSYLRQRGQTVTRAESSFLNGRAFDVVFSRIFGCETKYCREQKAYFDTKAWADKDLALRSRLVFDLDGNGISGRYYKLLASKSTPLKQTVLREWHDERLVPWVHYVPVSQSLKEVPELVSYLTSTAAGQQRAKEIAEQGRVWFSKAFREVDMTIYVYRLLLELARLQDVRREAS